jgi:hypothetical protein
MAVSDEVHSAFVRLLQVIEPDAVMMMMEAYFDESGTHYGSPVMCVAGYLFTAENALHFDREWGEALKEFGLTHFHAADCAHGREETEALSRAQRDELMVRLVGIIKRRIELGIAVSVSETDFGRVDAPKWERGGPYLLAALHVLGGVAAWIQNSSYAGKVSYFFESGDKHQGLTNQAIDMLKAKGSGYLGYYSHTFIGKCDARGLQAADLLAYEWQKELKRINLDNLKVRPMRRSLERLLDRTHITQHFTAEELRLWATEEGPDNALLDKARWFDRV